MKFRTIILILTVFLVSCEDFLDPKISEERSFEQLLTQPGQVKGLATFAYRAVPSTNDNFSGDFLDCATDNAVSNNIAGTISRTAENSSFWSATWGPFYTWNNRYEEISNLNEFFYILDNYSIRFLKSSKENDSIFRAHSKGEAYFLRAWCYFDLLRTYGGKDINGEMKGVPVVTEVIAPEDFLQLSRPGYDVTLNQIIEDLDSAIQYLPEEWDAFNPSEYLNLSNLGRPTDMTCLMLKSRALLYAASPAFTDGLSDADKKQRWMNAAVAAKEALDMVGFSLPDIYINVKPDLRDYFNNPQNDELIYRRVTGTTGGDRSLETNHAIPTLYGKGRCNPTQNLVDAFPMQNGYPITDGLSNYNPDSMYANRDPRFYMTILYNGARFGSSTIETFTGGKDLAGGSVLANVSNSTRTGYYLRKGLSTKVNLASGQTVDDYHYAALFRKVEMHLNFAEAANEAVDPGAAINGLTAEAALAEVRRRAGIASGGSDDYLVAQAGNTDDFRNLVKNERRIELCFEGHRFFDLRRWKDPLSVPVYKVSITKQGADNYTYEKVKMFDLAFDNATYYCPLPQTELNKTDMLTQNEKW